MEKRKCTKCGEEKPLTNEFFTKDKYDKSGLTYTCSKCRNAASYEWNRLNKDKVKQANLKNREKRKVFYDSPEGVICSRKAHLKRTYGITLDQFNEKLKEQNNKCAICNSTNTHDKHGVMAVDHNHSTGAIRGLLCYKCNAGIGLLNDNKEILTSAIKYLEKYE